jgi:predicted O-methyltransferase YrrM
MLQYRNQIEKPKSITVFYHLFIPDTNNMWVWWIDEQMGLLKSSGLADKARINMCVTLPLGLHNSKTGHSYDEMVFGYIKDRYPFVNIIDTRPLGEQPNLYEGQTLAKLYEHCQNDDGYVFYFHNKGMSSYSTHIPGAIKDWRHYMQYYNIEKWEDCIAKLDEGYECCGVDWVERHDIKLDFVVQHYAGNFWWARNDYIRKLKHPIKIEEYMDVEAMMRELQNYRYCFELWMATGNPKQHCFHYRRHHQYDNQGLERYFTYFPPEMYREDIEKDETKYNRNKLDILMEVGNKNLFNWRDHRQFADWIVRYKKPEKIVDLGVDYAYSTFCFAIPEIGHVYGIDSFEGDVHAGERDTEQLYKYVTDKQKELELNNITFIKGFFDDVVQTWDKKIDILHIDGLHTYEAVKNDFEKWSPFLKEGGIILMHDTMVENPEFGVSTFFKEISLPKTNFRHCNGLGVVSKDINLINEIKKNFGEFIREI